MGLDKTYSELIEMAHEAAMAANTFDKGVVISVAYNSDTKDYEFVLWHIGAKGMTKHRLASSVTSQDRLNAHASGFAPL